jgi:D-sedoheptulose 7-phosphate isomerase
MNSDKLYHERLIEVIQQNANAIAVGIKILSNEIFEAIKRGNNVWIIGNGGSASTAEHFETDLAFVRHNNLSIYPTVTALTANSSLVTATSNDISYEDLFGVIVARRGKSDDILLTISASGNSPNILNALLRGKSQRLRTFSLLGFDGGQASKISDKSIVVLTQSGEYGIVEDIHLSICHAVSMELLKRLTR